MLSVMTVQIITLSQTLTNNGIAFSQGTLNFSNYSKDGEIKTELGYEAYGTAAVSLMNAKVTSNGVAIGFIDNINKTPVFKIHSFVPASLPVAVVEFEKEHSKTFN